MTSVGRVAFGSAVLLASVIFLVRPAEAGNDDAWGAVKGRIVLDSNLIPAAKEIDVTKDQEHCLSRGKLFSEELVVNKANKGVRYTFVWLAPQAGDPPLKIHPNLLAIKDKEVEIDQ